MPIELDDRGRALENDYFRRKEAELLEKMRAKISEDARNLEIKCPKCDGSLHEANFENIVIDVCDKCNGVWLDAGELAQVTHKDEGGFFSKLLS